MSNETVILSFGTLSAKPLMIEQFTTNIASWTSRSSFEDIVIPDGYEFVLRKRGNEVLGIRRRTGEHHVVSKPTDSDSRAA